MVKGFVYNTNNINALEAALTVDRLSTYVNVANTKEAALELYVWNTEVSAAFYGPLQALEVTTRNAFHDQLTRAYGVTWWDDPKAGLTPQARQHVQDARDKLRRENKPVTPSRIVAELSFGFWERLLTIGPRHSRVNYDSTLWRPALYKAFPNVRTSRHNAHRPLPPLRNLRNRIAHHEPIFGRNLADDHQLILDVLGWMNTEARDWVAYHSVVPAALAARP